MTNPQTAAPGVAVDITEADIDRALNVSIPGGSTAEAWFLPHEHAKGNANVRDVVRRMLASRPSVSSTAGDWAIDKSTGTDILVYKNCSVIQDEQAHEVLNALRTALLAGAAGGGETVYLVHSGLLNGGEALYTRHDDCPPLCDVAKLYTARPSKEWYAQKIAETDGIDSVLPSGALAAQPPAVAAIPEGWKLVPIEPTAEISNAVYNAMSVVWRGDNKSTPAGDYVYAAMIAAAPQPPAGQQDRGEAETALRKALDEGVRLIEGHELVSKTTQAYNWAGTARAAIARSLTTPTGWKDMRRPPVDEHVILATSGGHVGEASIEQQPDGSERWEWAGGSPVHPNLKLIAWHSMLPHPEGIAPVTSGEVAVQGVANECRTDGRCQYAIDHGAEGMGHCPKGACALPAAPSNGEGGK